MAELLQDSVVIWDSESSRRVYRMGYYGKPLGIPKPKDMNFESPLILSIIEALYLLEEGVLEVLRGGEKVTAEKLQSLGRAIEENFSEKYSVYKDLRKRGFVVTPGLKFGSDFAVYKHGPGIDHAPFIIQVKPRDSRISALEIVRSGRLATSVRKHFTIAVPEKTDGKITYALFEWWRA
ncbi:MAG: tRNA-intron lyase [Nitrososphaerota archaeon]